MQYSTVRLYTVKYSLVRLYTVQYSTVRLLNLIFALYLTDQIKFEQTVHRVHRVHCVRTVLSFTEAGLNAKFSEPYFFLQRYYYTIL